MKKALIGSIERYAIHDGPGIRTTVFFKGCPLHCPWCHNPEFIASKPEIAFYPDRCLGCGDCVEVCPERALSLERSDRVDFSRCTGCGLCAEACPAKALERVGRRYDLDELLEILLRDRVFYETSSGGVTLTGGEPTAQMEFAGLLLQGLRAEGIHTAIETSGAFSWDEFSKNALDAINLVLFDLKLADPVEHRRITGVDNTAILENLARLIKTRPDDVIVRIPVIPGYTASAKNMSALASVLKKINVRRCSLLPYHSFGLSKAERVGRKFSETLPLKSMTRDELVRWFEYFRWAELVEF